MPYDLCFSPEFFFAEGEPYDCGPTVEFKERPESVWQAILNIDDEDWDDMARNLFNLKSGKYLSPESVLDMIWATDTCSNLGSPVEVWIDPEGDYRIKVYEKERG
jgi:hypothetical protein